jgi:hypothetical protein
MRIKLLIAIVIVTNLLVTSVTWAQEPVKVEVTQVRGNIYLLTGQGGNIGLFIGSEGSFMVDDQFAPLTDKIIAAAKSVGGDVPKYLINTHFHGDVSPRRARTPCQWFLHRRVRNESRAGQQGRSSKRNLLGKYAITH